jgi:2-polyprenyl-3-methyl-5-hydroxy-6-metoxy-1,4-benzoquinol methylase
MDDPSLGRREHQLALHGLARVHALTGTAGRLWKPMRRIMRQRKLTSMSVMDIGCGDGLLLRKLWQKAQSNGCELKLIGCDFSQSAIELARDENAAANIPIELNHIDITRDALPTEADVVFCSLFLHHFSEVQVVEILQKFAAATRQLLLVEDLIRSRMGYYLCWLGVHLLSRSQVMRVDGLLSVQAAFSQAEMRSLLGRAKLGDAQMQKHWPERFLIQWSPEDRN